MRKILFLVVILMTIIGLTGAHTKDWDVRTISPFGAYGQQAGRGLGAGIQYRDDHFGVSVGLGYAPCHEVTTGALTLKGYIFKEESSPWAGIGYGSVGHYERTKVIGGVREEETGNLFGPFFMIGWSYTTPGEIFFDLGLGISYHSVDWEDDYDDVDFGRFGRARGWLPTAGVAVGFSFD